MGRHLESARTELGRFGRQVSGYAAHHLLPERFDLTPALVGSEGTLAVVTEATVRLVVDPAVRVVVVLGFESIVDAGHASPAVVAHGPTSCEGLDSRLVEVLRSRRGDAAVPPLPRGNAWLFAELAGEDADEVVERARRLVADDVGAVDAEVVVEPALQARLWRLREDGAGLAGRSPAGKPAWPGWEDAAVLPDQLGSYLERFDDAGGRARPHRGAVRALRRRLHPRPPRLPARPPRRHPRAPRVPGGRGAAGGRVRRHALR